MNKHIRINGILYEATSSSFNEELYHTATKKELYLMDADPIPSDTEGSGGPFVYDNDLLNADVWLYLAPIDDTVCVCASFYNNTHDAIFILDIDENPKASKYNKYLNDFDNICRELENCQNLFDASDIMKKWKFYRIQ